MRATEAKKLFIESNKYVPHFQRLTEVIKTISMSGGDCMLLGDKYKERSLTMDEREHILAWLEYNGYCHSQWEKASNGWEMAVSWGNSLQSLVLKRAWKLNG